MKIAKLILALFLLMTFSASSQNFEKPGTFHCRRQHFPLKRKTLCGTSR